MTARHGIVRNVKCSTMKIEAFAKVNFTLEVLGRREDGYHTLRSIVVPITLSDTLSFELSEDLTSDAGFADDLCLKAARVLREVANCPNCGARICVQKQIPVGGGLGGGSADAAATLVALNELWGCGLTPEQLAELGAIVGSDVPALVLARFYGPILMEGRGEVVTPLNEVYKHHLVLVNPGVFVSTPAVFRACTPRCEGSLALNDLEAPAIQLHPEITQVKAALIAAGAQAVRMTGSGPTMFGFVSTAEAAQVIVEKMQARGWQAWAVKTYQP